MGNVERLNVEKLAMEEIAPFVETLEAWINGHYSKYGVELYGIIEGFYEKNREKGNGAPKVVDELCDSWNSFLLGAAWIGYEMALKLSRDRIECLSMAISDELMLEAGSLLVFDMMKAKKLKDERDIVGLYLKICGALEAMVRMMRMRLGLKD